MFKYLLVILGTLATFGSAHEPFVVRFQWNYINYTWPSEDAYLRADREETYVEKNNVIAGIKIYKDRMYLTIPRWKDGVPVTLAVTSAVPINGTTAPKLEPYPNWDMQKIGDCSALQSVKSMEIDPLGRMWILDTGRVATLTLESKSSCPPRLVIIDLENNGAVLRSYPFPADVANPDTTYLNDIVVDHEDGGIAYITDSDPKNSGIIVFSLANRTSWKIHHDSMDAKKDAVGFIVEQTRVKDTFNLNGIALSPANTEGDRTVYYCPLSSFNIFSIPTKILRDQTVSQEEINKSVKVLGRKPSQTDGMVMSNTGVLYFGLLADDAVSMWNSHTPSFVTGQRIISRDHNLMQWPNSFAFADSGYLWAVTNRLHLFYSNSINIEEPNFRVIVSNVTIKSYQYYEDGTSPELPVITAGAAHQELAFATIIAIVLLFIAK